MKEVTYALWNKDIPGQIQCVHAAIKPFWGTVVNVKALLHEWEEGDWEQPAWIYQG